jgi:hypothetical protein
MMEKPATGSEDVTARDAARLLAMDGIRRAAIADLRAK